MNADNRQELIDVLGAAGPAHHQAYLDTDGFDPDWPWWYAGHLRTALNRLLGVDLTRSEWVYWLISAEHARQLHTPPPAWPTFYANYFLTHTAAAP